MARPNAQTRLYDVMMKIKNHKSVRLKVGLTVKDK